MEVPANKPFGAMVSDVARLTRLAVRLVWRAGPRLLLIILLLIVAQAMVAPLQLALSKAVLDRAAVDLGVAAAPAPLAERLPLVAWIALTAASLAVGQLLQPFAATFQAIAGDRLTGYVTEQLMAAANRWRGLVRFEDPGFADDLTRARNQAAHGGLNLVVYGARAGVALFTAAGLVLVLASLHPLIPIIIVLAALPQMAREWDYGHRMHSHLYVQTPEARRLQYSRETLLAPADAKDVRLYGLGPFFGRQYDAIFARTMGALDRLRRRLAVSTGLTSALAAAVAGAVYVYLAWLITRGERTIGDLALYGGAATMLHARLAGLGTEIGFLPLPLGFLPSLFRVLDAPPDLPLPANPRPAPRPIREGIVFEHVAFAYPHETKDPSSTPVLRDVSFIIRPGECVALVGRNGAGKTTIVKLLLRLYDPCTPPGSTQPPGR
ncbi:MAG: ABC transporter ATP-binding protein, partial [Chloroflexi bacterium]|nr:ABC transporter ATP-binding protein [Chloroflexota bacterium]